VLSADELSIHIKGCALNNRESQKKIYNAFYGYAMSVCDCYSNNEEDSLEIMNDGFLKIFKEVYHFTPSFSNELNSFKGWLRRIMVNTSIDHYRKNKKHLAITELDTDNYQLESFGSTGHDKLSYDEIIRSIQNLSPAYRTVLTLFVVEGYTHEEIAGCLGISVGASKSNLSKARKQLQKMIFNENKIIQFKHVG
jgi:RNA polymerase sigma factor (sigma-70 family)